MIKQYLFLILIALFGIPVSYAEDLERIYTSALAKTITYIDNHQAAVWPGFHLSATPTIMHFRDNQHLYAYNFKPGRPDWQMISINDNPVYFMDKDAYDISEADFDFNVAIDDQLSFVIAQPFFTDNPADITLNMFTLVHERFHMFYAFESTFPHDQGVAFAGFNQLDNVKLSYLEMAADEAYLHNQDEKGEVALQDAVAIHQYRSTLLDKNSFMYEKQWEVIEGIAAYAGWKGVNITDEDYIQRVDRHRQSSNCVSLSERKDIQRCLYWSWWYFTGSIAGRALEQRIPADTWKAEAVAQGKPLEQILQDDYHMSTSEAAARTQAAMQNPLYGYDKISAALDTLLKPYLDEMNRQQQAYAQTAGIEIVVSLFPEEESLHHDKSYLINTNLELLTNASDDFKTDDGAIEIHYKNIPYFYNTIMLRDTPAEGFRQKFKIAADTRLSIDGTPIVTAGNYLQTGKRVVFHQLILEDTRVIIKINGALGYLDGSDGVLTLTLQQNTDQKRHRTFSHREFSSR